MRHCFLGVDVGSISTCFALVDREGAVLATGYHRTHGRPVETVPAGLKALGDGRGEGWTVDAVGATGSGRYLASALVGGDVVKNEITAHAVAAIAGRPDVRTVLEIGGQDSKIIIVRDGVVVDFAMNTICAAGTGSFLDHQAWRLGVPIEEFGGLALRAGHPVNITGRCTVFAESDLIHKQQVGHSRENLVAGLCEALARNYLGGIAKDKDVRGPVLFQGGVAANVGMVQAFEKELGLPLVIPEHFDCMGAIGAALLARGHEGPTAFRGFDLSARRVELGSFHCDGCTNLCEIVEVRLDGTVAGRWGGRCPRWTGSPGTGEDGGEGVKGPGEPRGTPKAESRTNGAA
jgi:predicted CoA-substrate-specific enzyme activase